MKKNSFKFKYSAPISDRRISIDGDVIFSVFAGRKRYMEILLYYIDKLYKGKLIDKVHLWDYTRNDEDKKYLHELCRNVDYLELFVPENNQRDKLFDASMCLWQDYYNYYINNLSESDILVKCDDDVVYINTEGFEYFVNQIDKDCLYFPNVVNNDVGAAIQTSFGLHDHLEYFDDHLSKKGCDEPITGWENGWFKKYEKAHLSHELFLKNDSAFDIKSDNILWQSRFSINMLAGKSNIIKRLFAQFLESECTDDEAFLSAWSCKENDISHIIVPNSTIVHFGFNLQDVEQLDKRFLDKYRAKVGLPSYKKGVLRKLIFLLTSK